MHQDQTSKDSPQNTSVHRFELEVVQTSTKKNFTGSVKQRAERPYKRER